MLDMSEWEKLRLYKKLGSSDQKLFLSTVTEVAELIDKPPSGLDTFVDHSIDHCYRVAKCVEAILPKIELNKAERLALLYSIIFHDIGMWTRRGEIYECMDNDKFTEFAKKQFGAEALKKVETLIKSENKWIGELALLHMVALCNREYHPKRSADIVRDGKIVKGVTSKTLLGIIARIIEAHGLDSDRVLKDPGFNKDLIVLDKRQEPINVRYLAFLLRLGDLLDTGEPRIPYLLWEYLSPLPPESEIHWKRVENLKILATPDQIEIFMGNFGDDEIGERALQLAKKWINYIKNDIENLRKLCEQPVNYGQDDRPKMGNLELKNVPKDKFWYIKDEEVEALKSYYELRLGKLERMLRNLEMMTKKIFQSKEPLSVEYINESLKRIDIYLQSFKPLLDFFIKICKLAEVANWRIKDTLNRYVHLCNGIGELSKKNKLPQVSMPLLNEVKLILEGDVNV